MVLDLVFCGRVDGKQQQIEILGTGADLWDQNQSRSRHILMNRVGFMKTSTPQSVTYIFPASLCGFRCCEAVCGTGFRVFVRLFTGTRRSKYSQIDAERLRPAGYSYLPVQSGHAAHRLPQ